MMLISADICSVVYSEMQGRENLQDDLMNLQMHRLLYSEDDGYRYETGGLGKALRVLTAERIRQFHSDIYQPKNIRLVNIGVVDYSNLFSILDKFENSIIDKIPVCTIQTPMGGVEAYTAANQDFC
jgi:Zn-dependent M16 (insulinase) family peptidase